MQSTGKIGAIITFGSTQHGTSKLLVENRRCLFSTFYIAAVILIAPFKFGSVVNTTGIGFYPQTGFAWIFSPWPPFLLPAVTGIALGLSMWSGLSIFPRDFSRYKHLLLPIASLTIVSFIGIIRTTEYDAAILFIWYLIAVLNFVLAVFIQLRNHPTARTLFLGSIAVGTVLLIVSGLNQVMYGFDETRELAIRLAREENRQLTPDLLNRLNQTRVFATFTYPNNYAAHLILTLPITIYSTWSFARKFNPVRVSQMVLTTVMTATSMLVLTLSGSRGAVCSLFIATAAIILADRRIVRVLSDRSRRMIPFVAVCLISIFGVAVFMVSKDRDFASIGARFDYYQAALKMFLHAPLLGVGLGEFFPWYMRLKPPGAEETRLVHNLFLNFLSQCGLFGGIAAGYFLLQPLLILNAVITEKLRAVSFPVSVAGLAGCLAWNIHSLTDFNIQIPGTVLIASILPLLIIRTPHSQPEKLALRFIPGGVRVIFVGLVVIGLCCVIRIPGERSYQRFYSRVYEEAALEDIIHEVQNIARLLPNSPYPWDLLGRIAIQKNNYPVAEMAFTEALQRTPHRASYSAYMSRCFLAKGDLKSAEESIAHALTWYPHKPEFREIARYIDGLKLGM